MTIVIFLMLVEFVAFAPSFGASQQLIRSNYSKLFRGYNMEQCIAYRIGQVECLKSLLQGENRYLGLGSLHRGNYSCDISRFALKQRIAYLLGQVNCLKIHLNLNQDVGNDSKMVPPNLGRRITVQNQTVPTTAQANCKVAIFIVIN